MMMKPAVLIVAALLLAMTASAVHNRSKTYGMESYASPANASMWKKETYHLVAGDKKGAYLVVPDAHLTDGEAVFATIIANNSMSAYGWDYVVVKANESMVKNTAVGAGEHGRLNAYKTAGYLEGFVTANRLLQVYSVTGNYAANLSAADKTWVADHIKYMSANAKKAYAVELDEKNFEQVFWRKVGDLFAQMEGLVEGVAAAVSKDKALTFTEMFYLNFNDEIGDVQYATKNENDLLQEAISRKFDRRSHCSALIKNVGDEIFLAHTTWGGYTTMVRQYKTYAFETTVVMSSVAGTISSGDDWYMVQPAKLAVTETTNEFADEETAINLCKKYVKPESASEFVRAMVANYVAKDGPTWAKYFLYNNSGTYNNQYMILDTKLFNPDAKTNSERIPNNTLYVLEQMPGDSDQHDVSESLYDNGYWASYNRPYFSKIFDGCGFSAAEKKWGSDFSYTKYARAEIFHRDQAAVMDLDGMKKILRYNEWQTDEFSKIPNCPTCEPSQSPWLTIAARGDLVPDNQILPKNSYGKGFVQWHSGAIDGKITSTKLMDSTVGHVVCGPTHETQDVFNWATSPFPHLRPPGSPEVFDFDWVQFNYPTATNKTSDDHHHKDSKAGLIAGIVLGCIVLLGVFAFALQKSSVPFLTKQSGNPDGEYSRV